MHIVFDKLEAQERAIVEKELAGHTLTFLDTSLAAEDTLPADTDIVSVFVSSTVTRAHIQSAPNLKLIATRSMGYDHIDQVAAKERSITIAYVPAYGTHTVAEFAFALLLELSRKAYPAYLTLRGDHAVDSLASEGFDLHGKSFGVVGTGKIGKNAARLGKAFGMKVALYDVFKDDAFAKEIEAPYLELSELVASSDIISIHVPLLPSTQHLINDSVLAKAKRGMILINTSRGGVVDTVALRAAIESGQLGGAGLDVFEGEKEIFGADLGKARLSPAAEAAQAMFAMPNVIMTPHIAYDTAEAKLDIMRTALDGITSYISGSLKNMVAL